MPDDYSFNYCGIASKELVSTLIIEGIWAKTVHGKYICEDHGRTLSLKHIWVRVGELFVDITLDQFNYHGELNVEKVIIVREKPKCIECSEDWHYDLYGMLYDPYMDYLQGNIG